MKAFLGLALGLLLLFSVGGASSAAGGRASAPALHFASLQPVALIGRSFQPAERIRVRILAGRKLVRRQVTAGSSGRFIVQTSITVDPCIGVFALAVGNKGSRAKATTGLRACPPSQRPNGGSAVGGSQP